VLPPKQE